MIYWRMTSHSCLGDDPDADLENCGLAAMNRTGLRWGPLYIDTNSTLERTLAQYAETGGYVEDDGGDLRWYIWVQFFPLATLPFALACFPPSYTRASDFIVAAAWYGLAMVFQAFDHQIYELGHLLCGHSIKHLAVNGTVVTLYIMLRDRERVDKDTGTPIARNSGALEMPEQVPEQPAP